MAEEPSLIPFQIDERKDSNDCEKELRNHRNLLRALFIILPLAVFGCAHAPGKTKAEAPAISQEEKPASEGVENSDQKKNSNKDTPTKFRPPKNPTQPYYFKKFQKKRRFKKRRKIKTRVA